LYVILYLIIEILHIKESQWSFMISRISFPLFTHRSTFCYAKSVFSFYITAGSWIYSLIKTDFLEKNDFNGLNEKTDQELAQKMNSGDDRAFEELYERYFQKLYSFVLRRVGHAPTAEDLLSDIFLKAFSHRKTFVWKTSFSSWIYKIATNRITDHYRTKKIAEPFNPEDDHHQPIFKESVVQTIDNDLFSQELEQILEKLSVRERLIITLKFYNEYSHEEIGKILHLKASHVGVLLHRALKKCQRILPEKLKNMLYDSSSSRT